MTDNMRKFLETASRDEAFVEKINKAETPEAIIALAAEKGFTLTAEDLKPEKRAGEVSDDELDAVAGGKTCACVLGGGGERGGASQGCGCFMTGIGEIVEKDYGDWQTTSTRCFCAMGGGGEDHAI